MTNARAARDALVAQLGSEQAVARHFVAVSTNADGVKAFGIDEANMFGFHDWVGGRYSMESAIGLSTMIAIGPEHYRAHAGRLRTRSTSTSAARRSSSNLPALMGLLTVWYNNFFGFADGGGATIRPISQALPGLPPAARPWRATANRRHAGWRAREGRIRPGRWYWGEPGTNGQHSFYQLIHQGTQASIPCDFIGFLPERSNADRRASRPADGECVRPDRGAGVRQDRRAQLKAEGIAPDWLVPHRTFEGNRPTNTILAEQADA